MCDISKTLISKDAILTLILSTHYHNEVLQEIISLTLLRTRFKDSSPAPIYE